jgi:hypothetical protein
VKGVFEDKHNNDADDENNVAVFVGGSFFRIQIEVDNVLTHNSVQYFLSRTNPKSTVIFFLLLILLPPTPATTRHNNSSNKIHIEANKCND